MPRISGDGSGWQAVVFIALLAVVLLYLFGQFFTISGGAVAFNQNVNVDTTALNTMKILILGAAAFGAYALFKKFTGGSMSSRDAFTVVLIGLFLFFFWDKVLQPILNANSLNNIAFGTGTKLGFFKP